MTDQSSTAERATSQAQHMASSAADRGKEVAGVAGGQVQQVAGVAREQVSQVTDEASFQVAKLVDDAKLHLRDQAQAQASQVGDMLGQLAVQLRAMSDGRPEDAGPVADLARGAAERVEKMTARIQGGGFGGAVSDLKGYARRRPVVFLAGALVGGLAAGRLVRAGRESGALSAAISGGPASLRQPSMDEPSMYQPSMDQAPSAGELPLLGQSSTQPTVVPPPPATTDGDGWAAKTPTAPPPDVYASPGTQVPR